MSDSDRQRLVKTLLSLLLGLVLTFAVAVSPLLGISPKVGLLPPARAWQESVFCLFSIISGGLAGLIHARLPDLGRPVFEAKEWTGSKWRLKLIFKLANLAQPYLLPAGKSLFAFLFFSAIVLCQRLRLGLVLLSPPMVYLYRNVGLVVFVLSLILLVNELATTYGARRKSAGAAMITHPIYLSALLAFIGAPMIFATWLPLVALPGIFVIMKWLIIFEETYSPLALCLLNSDADNNGMSEKKWRLVPYLF